MQQDPVLTCRRLLDNLSHLIFPDLTRQSLFSDRSFLINILEHIPRRHVGLGIIVGVGLFPIGCQLTPVVEIVRMEQFTVLVFVVVDIHVGMERHWLQVGRVPGKTLGCRGLCSHLGESCGCVSDE